MEYLLFYAAAMSLAAFLTCYYDKRAAVRHKRRISERCLFVLSALGGSYGFLMGMLGFRHKTRKLRFVLGIPALCALDTAALLLVSRLL